MPIHFPTDAANDPGMDDARRLDKGHARSTPAHHSRTGANSDANTRSDPRTDARADEARPGKGINQAGFIRERDRDTGPDKDA